MNPNEIPDYGIRYYQAQHISRKRQIIDQTLDQLHEMQMQMIEDALALSDMSHAQELIKHIMAK